MVVKVSIFLSKNALRVQVPNNHILTQNLYYNHYYPKPNYLAIGYLDPLGYVSLSMTQTKDQAKALRLHKSDSS